MTTTYDTVITVYQRRNHIIRIEMDSTVLPDVYNAIVTLAVRTGGLSDDGAVVLTKTNRTEDTTQAAIVDVNMVEFYFSVRDTAALVPQQQYTADASIEMEGKVYQLLAPTGLRVVKTIA